VIQSTEQLIYHRKSTCLNCLRGLGYTVKEAAKKTGYNEEYLGGLFVTRD